MSPFLIAAAPSWLPSKPPMTTFFIPAALRAWMAPSEDSSFAPMIAGDVLELLDEVLGNLHAFGPLEVGGLGGYDLDVRVFRQDFLDAGQALAGVLGSGGTLEDDDVAFAADLFRDRFRDDPVRSPRSRRRSEGRSRPRRGCR